MAVPDDDPEPAHEPVSVAAAALPDDIARLRAGLAEIDSPEARMWHAVLRRCAA